MKKSYYHCQFCGKNTKVSRIYITFYKRPLIKTKKVGCPNCGTFVKSPYGWAYHLIAHMVSEQIELLEQKGMSREELVSYVLKTKDLKKVRAHFKEKIRAFEEEKTKKNS